MAPCCLRSKAPLSRRRPSRFARPIPLDLTRTYRRIRWLGRGGPIVDLADRPRIRHREDEGLARTRPRRSPLRASFRRVSPVALLDQERTAAPTKRSIHSFARVSGKQCDVLRSTPSITRPQAPKDVRVATLWEFGQKITWDSYQWRSSDGATVEVWRIKGTSRYVVNIAGSTLNLDLAAFSTTDLESNLANLTDQWVAILA